MNFFDILNNRLDEIQDVTTDELLNSLSIETEYEPNNVDQHNNSAEPTDTVEELIQPEDLGIEMN